MKHILTTVLLIIVSVSFSQKDLGLTPRKYFTYYTYIADDGSFVIHEGADYYTTMWYSYDSGGNKIFEKKGAWPIPQLYDPIKKEKNGLRSM